MINLSNAIATVCGIGYIKKGAGTAASVAFCFAWYFIPALPLWVKLLSLVIILSLGVWSGNKMEKIWGKDSNKIVIDEVAGMMLVLIFIPTKQIFILVALVLFRFFDIAKPFGIKKAELLPGGWGVMADDVVAGIYSLIIIRIGIILNFI
ncbi:MAG: phosphatidylglycerophosphatase A [Lacibacter sp.]|jgi:phosphatidylglycerophosphatase A